ncbi:hypothetical protein Ddye_015730, partial [Dipteronia dyeriana]
TLNSGDQETFFDCHPCLPSASDSEDDFRSVNSEFSRSYRSSPRHRFSCTCPPLNKTITRNEADNNNYQQGHFPVKQDKKLYQLFDDPFWSDQVVTINNGVIHSSNENVCRQNSKGCAESDDHQNINSPCICIPISFLKLSFTSKKKLNHVLTY